MKMLRWKAPLLRASRRTLARGLSHRVLIKSWGQIIEERRALCWQPLVEDNSGSLAVPREKLVALLGRASPCWVITPGYARAVCHERLGDHTFSSALAQTYSSANTTRVIGPGSGASSLAHLIKHLACRSAE
jgi:hypothetical protein